jgi:hypothetical protein
MTASRERFVQVLSAGKNFRFAVRRTLVGHTDQDRGLLRFISFTQIAASREVLLGKKDLQ